MALPKRVKIDIKYEDNKKKKESLKRNVDSKKNDNGSLIHTVVFGDNLWNLAKKYYGSGKKFEVIYEANRQKIEALVKKNGKSEHYKGYWISPGMKLVIPGINSGKAQKGTNVKTKQKKHPKSYEENLADVITDFSFIDVADGKSDSLSLTLCDINKVWLGKQRPKKGSMIGAKILIQDEKKKNIFECGDFLVDDISFSGRPLICNIGAVNVPISEGFKTLKKTNTWQKTNLKDIASKIAKGTKVELFYDAENINIDEIEQNNETDSEFLYNLCSRYGLGMKIYKKKIVIFDFAKYEKKKPVMTISEKKMLSWSANTTITGTYTGVKFSYTIPTKKKKKKETIKVMLGKTGRLLFINNQSGGKIDAELQAVAALNGANRKTETMRITVIGGLKLTSTQCIKIKGLKSLDGKYFIDEIKHEIGDKGYIMELDLHKVQKPIKA